MPSVAHLLPALARWDAALLGGTTDQEVRAVTLVDEIERLREVAPQAVVLVTPRASAEARGYQLDVSLRLAATAGASLVALYGLDELPRTARRVAERAQLAVVRVARATDPSTLLLALHHELHADAPAALARLIAAQLAIERAEPEGAEAVLAAAGRAAGCELWLAADEATAEPQVRSSRPDDPADAVVRRLAGDAIARIGRREQRSEALLLRSRAQILSELLTGTLERAAIVADRARAVGLPVDGWHRVVRVEIASGEPADALAVHELMDELAALANRALGAGSSWVVAVIDLSLVLAYMDRHEAAPPPSIAVPNAERVLSAIRRAFPALDVVLGLGAVHVGLPGLRTSAAEARSAVETARARGLLNRVLAFDATGLRRMLVEWLASDTARRSVEELLAPLDELGPERARELVQTLGAYLDERGSLQRAGRRLHLHPNAVAYRMRRIVERLGCDLDDADERLALQIACRGRLMLPAG